jgi:hypothetical protein
MKRILQAAQGMRMQCTNLTNQANLGRFLEIQSGSGAQEPAIRATIDA